MKLDRNMGVYLVTDAALCGRRGVVATVREAVQGGVRVLQIRDKSGDAAPLLALTIQVARAVGDRARIIVNDRVDVYLAARLHGVAVHGVHVGQTDLPATDIRKLIGPDAILGLTANVPLAVAAALRLPAGTVDYLGIGVIHASATKPDHPPVLGGAGFARLAQAAVGMPCVAIGGIQVDDIAALRRRGAAGVAVVSAICASRDPQAAARTLVNAWTAAA